MTKKEHTTQECLNAFCEAMNAKADSIGMTKSCFRDPAGGENISTAGDMLRCLVMASGYEALYDIWNREHYTVKIRGQNERELPLTSSVTASADSHCLSDTYRIMGGKTGSHGRKEIYNLIALVEVPETDDWLACSILYAEQSNGNPNNRFVAAKQAVDAAMMRYKDKNADNSGAQVCAQAVAVCKKPKNNPRVYSMFDIPLLFEKNASEEKEPKSATKVLTAMITLDYISDLYSPIIVTQEDVDAMPVRLYDGDLKPGDIITVKDALYAMLLPSSNAAAYILARFVGNRILETIDPIV